jgi:hypothetical protein
MTASDEALPFYVAARRSLVPFFPPDPILGPDLGPGDADAEGKLDVGVPSIRIRAGFPSELLSAAERTLLLENTVNHEIGHAAHKFYEAHGIDALGRYWTFRGFRGTWQQAAREADAMGVGPGWQFQPRESWAECFGASLSGRWTKPEKTFNDGRPIDALVARAFFQQLAAAIASPTGVPTMTWRPSPNFTPGRTRAVRYIVLHTTQGNDSRGWLTNPASQVSSHYLERDDDEYQFVHDEDTAWHAGRIVGTPTTSLYRPGVNPNDESIGIEIEGFANELASPACIARTVQRIRALRQKFGPLPLVDHAMLSPGDRSDPGEKNRAAIFAALGEEDDMAGLSDADLAKIDAIVEAKVVAVERRLAAKIDSGFNQTFPILLRRVVRNILGTHRDPAGDPRTSPPSPYPDDATPII